MRTAYLVIGLSKRKNLFEVARLLSTKPRFDILMEGVYCSQVTHGYTWVNKNRTNSICKIRGFCCDRMNR